MIRRSKHRIWLRDLNPYVFCQAYKKKHQMKRHGEFEIYFVNEEGTYACYSPDLRRRTEIVFFIAADAFQDVFSEASNASIHGDPDASDLVIDSEPKTDSAELSSKAGEFVKDNSGTPQDGWSESEHSEVIQWQNTVNEANAQEDLSAILFEACVQAFQSVFHIIREKPDLFEHTTIDDLREEFRKFYVWNDIFPTASGELGSILSTSRNLKEAVFSLLAQWARALCKGRVNHLRQSGRRLTKQQSLEFSVTGTLEIQFLKLLDLK
jgi:hypothetical protein